MRRARRVPTLVLCMALPLGAQRPGADSLVVRGFDLESAQPREALALYRRALAGETLVPALLGMERIFMEAGQGDSLLAPIEMAVRVLPRDGVVRAVQFRTLAALRREDELRIAFRSWARAAPGEPAPFKEYARTLLELGQADAADSVLDVATRAIRDPRDFTAELAQVAAARGRWADAARRWRMALVIEEALVPAAVAALAQAPVAPRDTMREALLATPAAVAPRRALAELELLWGTPRRGWSALADLVPTQETAQAWRSFAESAEERGAPLAARDAWLALHRRQRDPDALLRATVASLDGGDASAALPMAVEAQGLLDPKLALRDALPARLRALAALGRAAEASALVDSVRPSLPAMQLRILEGQLAWGFLRAGDVTRARPLVARMDDDEASALLAVYDGDLATAREKLAGADASNTLLIVPRTLLARSTVRRAPATGAALALLAKGDSVAAIAALEDAASEVSDAAPFVLALAARVRTARGDVPGAIAAWRHIVTTHVNAPEAAEGDLAWARLALASGDAATATARLEHLILTYRASALVPQARRTLDEARRRAGGTSS